MNKQLPSSLQEIQALYPYQFSNPVLGVEVAKGWMPVFAQLCTDIDNLLGADKFGFHWSQIKEKYGSARFYYRFQGRKSGVRLDIHTPNGVWSQHIPAERRIRTERDKTFQEIDQAVLKLTMAAEVATQRMCLVCGQPGVADTELGYVMVLCPEHKAQRRQPSGLPRDFWENLKE